MLSESKEKKIDSNTELGNTSVDFNKLNYQKNY